MTIEAAFVDTLRAINKLDGRLREVERLSSTTTMATKKGRAATLASDAFTATFNYYRLTPEAGNTDDLSTINGGLEGRLLAIRTADAAYTITVKDGVGNIDLCGSDVSLDCEEKVLVLVYDSNLTAWIQYGVGSGGGGASDFLSLSDTPGAYAAQAGKHVRVNATPDALEFADPTFLELTDTPSSYASQASKYVSVNGAENALEFTTAPPGSVSSTVRNTFDFLNSAKASADTPDDEFDGGSLDVKWTVVAGSNAAMDFIGGTNVSNYALDTTNDVLQMQVGSNGSQLVQLRQDWTLGDGESIVVAFSPPIENIVGSHSNNQMNVLMTLNDDDTSPSSGNYLYISFDLSANHHHVQLYNGSVIVGDSIDENPASSTTWFLRFARDGTDYHGFWSTDGASWGYLGVDTGGDVFDNLWIHVENLAAYSAPALVTTWHWVRQGTNGVFPWSPMVPVVTNVDGNSIGNLGGLSTLTISSGAVTISSSTGFYSIAAETGTSDDLTTINGGSDGDIIVLCPDTGDTISVLETGNLQLSGTFTMDDPADKITLIYHSAISKWCEITSSGNA